MQTMILQTYAANRLTSHKAKVQNYGEVWFDNEGMATIFSFANMEDKYHITYDSTVESAFNMHTENGIIKFRRIAETKIQDWYHNGTNVGRQQEFLHRPSSFMSQENV